MEYFPNYDSDNAGPQRQAVTRQRPRVVGSNRRGLPSDGLMMGRPFVGIGETGLIEGYQELETPILIPVE